jgi:hypothetical protein
MNEKECGRADGTGVEFYGNDIYANTSGVYPGRVDYVAIHHNTIHDAVKVGSYEPYGIGCESCSYLDIHDNLIYNIYDNGIGIYGDSMSPTNDDGPASYNKVYRNVISGIIYSTWSKDIPMQGFVGSNNAIYNNILYSNDSRNEHFQVDPNNGTGNAFYGNTVVNGQAGFQNSGDGWAIRDNIFYKVTVPVRGSNLTFSNNIAYPSTSGVTNAINKDPLFVNPSGDWTGFRLQSTSPAIDAGANLGTASYNLAFDPASSNWPPASADQNSYGTGWEIGAFVYR